MNGNLRRSRLALLRKIFRESIQQGRNCFRITSGPETPLFSSSDGNSLVPNRAETRSLRGTSGSSEGRHNERTVQLSENSPVRNDFVSTRLSDRRARSQEAERDCGWKEQQRSKTPQERTRSLQIDVVSSIILKTLVSCLKNPRTARGRHEKVISGRSVIR